MLSLAVTHITYSSSCKLMGKHRIFGSTTIVLLVPELGPKVGKKSLRPLDKHQCEKNKRHEQKHAYITKSNISARVKNKRDTRIHNQVQYIRLFLASLPQTDDILSLRKQSLPNDQGIQGSKLVRTEVFVFLQFIWHFQRGVTLPA